MKNKAGQSVQVAVSPAFSGDKEKRDFSILRWWHYHICPRFHQRGVSVCG